MSLPNLYLLRILRLKANLLSVYSGKAYSRPTKNSVLCHIMNSLLQRIVQDLLLYIEAPQHQEEGGCIIDNLTFVFEIHSWKPNPKTPPNIHCGLFVLGPSVPVIQRLGFLSTRKLSVGLISARKLIVTLASHA